MKEAGATFDNQVIVGQRAMTNTALVEETQKNDDDEIAKADARIETNFVDAIAGRKKNKCKHKHNLKKKKNDLLFLLAHALPFVIDRERTDELCAVGCFSNAEAPTNASGVRARQTFLATDAHQTALRTGDEKRDAARDGRGARRLCEKTDRPTF